MIAGCIVYTAFCNSHILPFSDVKSHLFEEKFNLKIMFLSHSHLFYYKPWKEQYDVQNLLKSFFCKPELSPQR